MDFFEGHKELSQTEEYCDRLFTLGERLGEADY